MPGLFFCGSEPPAQRALWRARAFFDLDVGGQVGQFHLGLGDQALVMFVTFTDQSDLAGLVAAQRCVGFRW